MKQRILILLLSSFSMLVSSHTAFGITGSIKITLGHGDDCNGGKICSITVGIGPIAHAKPQIDLKQATLPCSADIVGNNLLLSFNYQLSGELAERFEVSKPQKVDEATARMFGYESMAIVPGIYRTVRTSKGCQTSIKIQLGKKITSAGEGKK